MTGMVRMVCVKSLNWLLAHICWYTSDLHLQPGAMDYLVISTGVQTLH